MEYEKQFNDEFKTMLDLILGSVPNLFTAYVTIPLTFSLYEAIIDVEDQTVLCIDIDEDDSWAVFVAIRCEGKLCAKQNVVSLPLEQKIEVINMAPKLVRTLKAGWRDHQQLQREKRESGIRKMQSLKLALQPRFDWSALK